MIRTALLVALMTLSGTKTRPDAGRSAVRLTCGDVLVIIAPATPFSLSQAHQLAECIGGASATCYVESIRIRDSERGH